ncbi:MAG: hypothetical protein EOP07_11735, partial [Proteobacteria bacterium]
MRLGRLGKSFAFALLLAEISPLFAKNSSEVGLETAFMVDRDLAENGVSSLQAPADTGSSAFVEDLFSRSIHFGQSLSLSLLNKNFAVTVFDRLEVDIEGNRYDNGGLPQINFAGEAYAGAMATAAIQPTRWFSIGVTGKYLYMGEPN